MSNREHSNFFAPRWSWAAVLVAMVCAAPHARADEPVGSTEDENDVWAHTGQPIKPGAGGDRFGGDTGGGDSAMPGPLNTGGLVPWTYVLNGPDRSRGSGQPALPLTSVWTLPSDLRTPHPMLVPAMPSGDGAAWASGAASTIPAPGAVLVIGGAIVTTLRRRRV
jgi:hypothetical protein